MTSPAALAKQHVENKQKVLREYMLRTRPGGVKGYDHDALCDLLEVDDPSRVIFEQGSGRQAVVRVFPVNPLAKMRAITLPDLVMDENGCIRIGSYYDGEPLRMRVHDPETGNAQRIIIFGTTGAGKSRALQAFLAACKRNGIVVHLADLKGGQSVPEAKGNVATHVRTLNEAMGLLRAAVKKAEDRFARYADMGRSGFLINNPDPLEYVVIDEANRLLEKGSPFRAEAARLIKELGRTGRSVGIGIVLAAQAGHLDELGGSDTLRAMLKEGEVILLRWSSQMMASLVGDGLLPVGENLQPIPKILGRARRIQRWGTPVDRSDEKPNSQGMCYHLTSARPTSMARFFLVGSLAPHDGFDPEIRKLYGSSPPPGKPLTLLFPPPKEGGADSVDGLEYGVDEDPELEELPETPKTNADRILAALDDGPLSEQDLLAALDDDGGKEVKRGSIRTTISNLRRDGKIAPKDASGLITPL
ncbi:transfer protein [Streptomyces viridochromogenes]|uniref:Transfer protein n=1 Tax=Streptomyces viridochromogenes TaxID=1938 RepID=A0A0J7ZDQ7_STRVR|nr:DNA/RNA helicase domain-containing protein [Streptomyces viridochromogenes]KMS74221.1 transfer protein [Streptomyces viridochromogenes]